ncbi:MAG TPA: O-antigen ligase family protein [Solirubrobacterales bacterium]|nr:O-antigen ligase family protein [Solirubrobacterales bacterium]
MSDLLAGAGVLVAAGTSATAILLPPGRMRSAAMLLALALFPVLILGDQWHTHQIVDLRHHTVRVVIAVALGSLVVFVLAYCFRRWPSLLPLAIIVALPFRIPLHAGGESANLLVPLYLVIAGGVVFVLVRDWGVRPATPPPAGGAIGGTTPEEASATAGGGGSPMATGPAGWTAAVWLSRILATFVVLYALQSFYSGDFSKGLQNVCFFLVPFTVAYALLQDVDWDRRLLTAVLTVVGLEAVAFVLIGSVEFATRGLFWNDQVIRSNEFHTYFRVNSVFWDPNVYGRYLSLAIVVATAALLWARDRRNLALLTGLVGVLWIGLAQTYSQSSFVALLAGLAVLAAIRWSWRWTLVVVAVGLVGGLLVVALVGGKSVSSIPERLNVDTSGRANLVSGGIELFAERPLWGYGSGSFQHAYREHRTNKDVPVSISHTEPVTVAAEQGLLGLLVYGALIVVALWTIGSGMWRGPPDGKVTFVARAAVLAAFVALLVHTLAYAGFFEDPIAWVLLAVGSSLATASVPTRESAGTVPIRAST